MSKKVIYIKRGSMNLISALNKLGFLVIMRGIYRPVPVVSKPVLRLIK